MLKLLRLQKFRISKLFSSHQKIPIFYFLLKPLVRALVYFTNNFCNFVTRINYIDIKKNTLSDSVSLVTFLVTKLHFSNFLFAVIRHADRKLHFLEKS